MNGQDWNTVSFSNSRPQSARSTTSAAGGKPATQAVKRPGGAGTSSGISAAALENETEELKHATVSKDLRLAITQARNAKGLTQKQLATQHAAAGDQRVREWQGDPEQPDHRQDRARAGR